MFGLASRRFAVSAVTAGLLAATVGTASAAGGTSASMLLTITVAQTAPSTQKAIAAAETAAARRSGR